MYHNSEDHSFCNKVRTFSTLRDELLTLHVTHHDFQSTNTPSVDTEHLQQFHWALRIQCQDDIF